MKLSTKGRYGLRILLDVALHGGEAPRLAREIASSQGISEKYISRLIIALRRAGLVVSVRGAKGGYRLGRFPESITLLDVVEAMEGQISLVACVQKPGLCSKGPTCPARKAWAGVNAKIRVALSETTLAEILKSRERDLDDSSQVEYCI